MELLDGCPYASLSVQRREQLLRDYHVFCLRRALLAPRNDTHWPWSSHACDVYLCLPAPRRRSARVSINHYILCTIQYNTIQYNTIQYNTIQYNTIQYNTIQYNTIQYNTIQYNTIQYNTIQYMTIQYMTIQYSQMYFNFHTCH